MRTIQLDGRKMDNRNMTHTYLKEALLLPNYYGRNLDALADCLSEMGPVNIRLVYPQAMLNALGEYGYQMIEVFKNTAKQNNQFIFQMVSH